MDLFHDIRKGKFGANPKLKKEAKHELGELGGEKLAEAHEKRVKEDEAYKIAQAHAPQFRKEYAEQKKKMAGKMGSFDRMNAERKRQGYKPKTDRATKGLYDFLDK